MFRGNYYKQNVTGQVDIVVGNEPNARATFFTISIEGTGDVTVETLQKGMTTFQPVVNSPITAGAGAQTLSGNIKTIRLNGTGPYTYSIDANDNA